MHTYRKLYDEQKKNKIEKWFIDNIEKELLLNGYIISFYPNLTKRFIDYLINFLIDNQFGHCIKENICPCETKCESQTHRGFKIEICDCKKSNCNLCGTYSIINKYDIDTSDY